jgi:hypothetical protein
MLQYLQAVGHARGKAITIDILEEGRLICDDPQEIEELLVEIWKESFQISDKLSDGCV